MQVCGTGGVRLLDHAMQKNHPSEPVHVEEHAADPVAREIGPDFVETASHRTTCRHPGRPAELDRHDVVADKATILATECLQPFPDGLSSSFGRKEVG